jgi:hypothetical protein
MTSEPKTTAAWGIFLSRLWGPRFPVDVRQIAFEYSKRFDDPVLKIEPADVGGGFEGALYPLKKKGGWAILYNPNIRSAGRINFTLSHEWGHYLAHRKLVPDGFECQQQGMLGFDRTEIVRKREQEADEFASYLLMPIDDFRKQVTGSKISLDLLGHCATRYGTSLTAAALKWIAFTPEAATLVYAVDDHVLWARPSEAARKAGIFFPKGMPLPAASLAQSKQTASGEGVLHPPGVWLPKAPVREVTIVADNYDATISLLQFPELRGPSKFGEKSAAEGVESMTRRAAEHD